MHALPEREFEELCRDLMAREETVATARLFRVRGKPQFGVDVVCTRNIGDGCEVAQCKRYASFSKADIRDAANEFFKHLAYWKDRSVKRFILMVTEPLQNDGQDDQLEAERKRFSTEGIRFEAWSIDTLTRKLRPCPDIVVRAFPHHAEYWVKVICGRSLQPFTARRSRGAGLTPKPAVRDAQFAELIGMAAAGVAAAFVEVRRVARTGRTSAAAEQLSKLETGNPSWAHLPAQLRGQALRLRAALQLDSEGELSAVKQLVDDADALDQHPSLRLRAQIVLEEQGPAAAIEFVDHCEVIDDDLIRIAAVCCLRAGDPQAALDRLARSSGVSADTETSRLRALALFSFGHVNEAVASVRLAVGSEPTSWAARMTLGMLLYYSALSGVADIDLAAGWPPPCTWFEVRRDDASVARLREAADIFSSLVDSGQERVRRENLEAWRLACLANDAARQDDAEAFCGSLLAADPTHTAAIYWALARSYPSVGSGRVLDAHRSKRALEHLLESGRGTLEHLAALATILGQQDKPKKIVPLIKKHERLFAFPGGAEQRRLLLVEVALRTGADTSTDFVPSVDLARAGLIRASRETDPDRAAAVLLDVLQQSLYGASAPGLRAEALARLAQLGKLREVAPYADWLVQSVGTADGLRLAAHAKASVDDSAGALEVIASAATAFPDNRLTRDLLTLQARCLASLGRLPLAITIMESLNDGDARVSDRVGLADLYVRRGDLASASRTLSGSASDPDLPPEQALRFASLLRHDAPELARALWDRVAREEVDPEWLPTMFELARSLGIGAAAESVAGRMMATAVPYEDEAPNARVRSLSLDQLQQFLEERRRQVEHLQGLYGRSEAPLHVVAPQLALGIADLFRADLLAREHGTGSGFLPAVHGGRAAAVAFPGDPSTICLHLDVTAAVLAAHLGILDAVERCFPPISISSHLVPALIMMRHSVLTGAVNEDGPSFDIVEAIHQGRATRHSVPDEVPDDPDADGLRQPGAEGRSMVVVHPDQQNGSGIVSQTDGGGSLAALLYLLADEGLMQPEEVERARSLLAASQDAVTTPLVAEAGTGLIFLGAAAHQAARAGMLAPACQRFRVSIDAELIDGIHVRRRARAAAEDLGRWLDALIQRIGTGIEDQTYRLLPLRRSREEPPGGGELLICLLDIFGVEQHPGNLMWVDDRWTNSFTSCGTGTLIGVCDVLSALRSYGRITAEEHYTRLLRLRASDVRYIGPQDRELEFWLSRAQVVDGVLLETPELACIRRYVAGCFVDEQLLQLPPVPDEAASKAHEVAFVVGWQRAVAGAIRQLWSESGSNNERAVAGSRWLRNNLLIEAYRRMPALQPTLVGRRVVLAGIHLALLGNWLNLFLDTASGRRRRCEDYIRWVDHEVLRPRLKADPDLVEEIGRQLKQFMVAPEGPGPNDGGTVRRDLLATFLAALPETVARPLLEDRELLQRLGIDEDTRVVSLGAASVSAAGYFSAVARALQGKAQHIRTNAGDMLAVTADFIGGAVRVVIKGKHFRAEVADVLDVLAQPDPELSRLALMADDRWIDKGLAAKKRRVEELIAIAEPVERCLEASLTRAGSAVAYYERVRTELADGVAFDMDGFAPPSAAAVLAHLRLKRNGGTLAVRLEAAAGALIAELGIGEAFNRLGQLPRPLPGCFLSAFQALPPEARARHLDQWTRPPASPLLLIHAARLRASEQPDPGQLAAALQAVADRSFETLTLLVNAFAARSGEWAGTAELACDERIIVCWAHSGLIYSVLRGSDTTRGEELREFARRGAAEPVSALLAPNLMLRADVASPYSVSAEQLAVRGLYYAAGEALGGDAVSAILPILKPLLTTQVGDFALPSGVVLYDERSRPDALGSFLRLPLGRLLDAVCGPGLEQWAGEAKRCELMEQCLAAAVAGGLCREWVFVMNMIGAGHLPARLIGRLREAVNAISSPEAPVEYPGLLRHVLAFVALQAAVSQDTGLSKAVVSMLRRVAPGLPVLTKGEKHETAVTLVSAIVDLVRDETGEPDVMKLGQLVREMADTSSKLTGPLRAFLTTACHGVPFSKIEGLWPTLLALRSLPN